MNHSIIATQDLTYRYSKRAAATLLDINLAITKGSIYGFLGPNGSGKTTTLSLMLGLLKSEYGSIHMFGQELNAQNRTEILKKVGSLIETPSLYGHLSARENLEVYRAVYGMPKERIDEVLAIVGLSETGKKIAKRFSLGMKQRLALALALMPKPELLILDEPTNGLDPQGIIELREIIKRLNKEEGITILVSSHILAEVEKLVTHLGIIFKGRMLFQGSLEELYQVQRHKARLLISTSDDRHASKLLTEHRPEFSDGKLTIAGGDPKQAAAVARMLIEHQLDVYTLQPLKNDLEQLFIDLTSNHI